jgi:predicted small secreted protein
MRDVAAALSGVRPRASGERARQGLGQGISGCARTAVQLRTLQLLTEGERHSSKETDMKRFWTALVCVMLAVGLISMMGCETTKGAGKDIEHAGEAIQGK